MINKITYTLLVSFFLLFCATTNGQDLKVIDNKGTLKSINKVTYGADANGTSFPTSNVKGDVYIVRDPAVGSTPAGPPKETYIFDGTDWVKIGSKLHTGTEGSVFFADIDGSPTEDNDHFFWDKNNTRLRIGSSFTTPGSNKLTVNGAIRSRGFNNANGTVGLPSYRFTSDSDTGMWRGSLANYLRFSTDGTEALTINPTQNIGIGIYAPTHKLDVNGKMKVRTLDEPSALINTDRLAFVDNDGVFKKISTDNLGFWKTTGNTGTTAGTNFLGTKDAQALVLKTNNVKKLEIHETKGQVLINNAPTFKNHPLVVRANGNNVLAFQNSGGVPKWHWNLLAGGLNFVESNVADYRLFLKNGGNVGVGTNGPTQKLDVNGSVRVRSLPAGLIADKIVVTDGNGVLKSFNGPRIVAVGRVNANGTETYSLNFSSTRPSNGTYRVTYDSPIPGNLIINATIWMDNINGKVRILKVTNIDSNGFNVVIVNRYGTTINDCGFMFTVNKLP